MSATRAVIVTGAGGVGKTTISAGLAVVAARTGKRTLVATVDPARRLADVLGVDELGNQPTPVAGEAGLWAAMLDVTASWEAIVHRHAESDVADRLVGNPYFRAIADRFPAAQSYAAAEQMAEYIESGSWDVVIVDTPPAAGGIDFFRAPTQMRELIGGRLLRWLTGARLPGRRMLYNVTARPVLRFFDNVLGSALLEEIAEFLLDLRSLYDGLSIRARSIEVLLQRATVLVAGTTDPTPLREARRFFTELDEVSVTPAAVVFNRQLPEAWARGEQEVLPIEREMAAVLAANLQRWGQEAHRGAVAAERFAAQHRAPITTLPWLEEPPTSLDALDGLVRTSEAMVRLLPG